MARPERRIRLEEVEQVIAQGEMLEDYTEDVKDDERNLQALCFRCNRAKRDQDATDFRLPRAKLVRDRVPEEIRASGRRPVVRQVQGRAYLDLLFDKLVEEHSELQAEATIEEVADMIEVLFGIAATLGYEEAATLEVVRDKRAAGRIQGEAVLGRDFASRERGQGR